jgi:beta-glucosidase/6-phospho-beta-glucosidase/beta-galactosidase
MVDANLDGIRSDFNQPTDPGGFREVLEVAASYGKPIWVTENGIADAGDSKRPSYIVNHIAVVQDLVAHGMDIRATPTGRWSTTSSGQTATTSSSASTDPIRQRPHWNARRSRP